MILAYVGLQSRFLLVVYDVFVQVLEGTESQNESPNLASNF